MGESMTTARKTRPEHRRSGKAGSFLYTGKPEEHPNRRKAMLEKYPDIRQLFGHEPKTKYVVLLLISIQCFLAYTTQHWSLLSWLLVIYCVGATINHSIFLAIHEITHHLAFKSKTANRCFAIFSNLILGIPLAMAFEKYHFMHHRFMGDLKKDVDIPTPEEAALFHGWGGKLIWIIFQALSYTIRPFIKCPQPPTLLEWINIGSQIVFDGLIIFFLGWPFFFFLILSSLTAMSLHPTAAHTLSEHYVTHPAQETYSYYGPLNRLLFNVGYHVEHHDFPVIPWTRIHRLKKMAPEYYENLHQHHSWLRLIIQFIFSSRITLFSRITRQV